MGVRSRLLVQAQASAPQRGRNVARGAAQRRLSHGRVTMAEGMSRVHRTLDSNSAYNSLQRILFLESIAAVPGMVAASLRHLRSLRLMVSGVHTFDCNRRLTLSWRCTET